MTSPRVSRQGFKQPVGLVRLPVDKNQSLTSNSTPAGRSRVVSASMVA